MTTSDNFDKVLIDQNLRQAILDAGVAEKDALELARMGAFGGAPSSPWVAGLRICAKLMADPESVRVDVGLLLDPWAAVATALSSNGHNAGRAILGALPSCDPDTQVAVISAISTLAATMAQAAGQPLRIDQTVGLSSGQVKKVVQDEGGNGGAIRWIDPNLANAIYSTLTRPGRPKDRKRHMAGEAVLHWLMSHGRFVQTMDHTGYYLYRDKHRLYPICTQVWFSFLYRVSGINPASTDFSYLIADCRTVAFESNQVEVVRGAHWDERHKTLRVSRFDGIVYRLDGHSIEEEANGDGPVIFDDSHTWLPYAPDFSGNGELLDWWAGLPNFSTNRQGHALVMRAWLLASFLTEACPTRPLLVLFGEAGSGKSMAFRALLRLLYGPMAQIAGLPTKEDGFTVGVHNSPIHILDSLDSMERWLQDKLALIAMGGADSCRKLYTNAEEGKLVYRSWIGITGRTPDTLKRDDLVDRSLIIPVERIGDDGRVRESAFMTRCVTGRNLWWGDLLAALNQVVATVHRDGIPAKSTVRMADFEALGRIVARSVDQ